MLSLKQTKKPSSRAADGDVAYSCSPAERSAEQSESNGSQMNIPARLSFTKRLSKSGASLSKSSTRHPNLQRAKSVSGVAITNRQALLHKARSTDSLTLMKQDDELHNESQREERNSGFLDRAFANAVAFEDFEPAED